MDVTQEILSEITTYMKYAKYVPELNENGQKVIPYMDYECEHEKLQDIFDSVMMTLSVEVTITSSVPTKTSESVVVTE